MKFQVLLSSVADVKDFVDAASACPSEVDVLSGRYVVNGKSIMGLFSVDLSAPVTVAVHGQGPGKRRFGSGCPALPANDERTDKIFWCRRTLVRPSAIFMPIRPIFIYFPGGR